MPKMDVNAHVEQDVLMAQIATAGQVGRGGAWLVGLSRAGRAYRYDAAQGGWHPLGKPMPGMVLTQVTVADVPSGEPPRIYGLTAAGNTVQYMHSDGAWWPLERRVLDALAEFSSRSTPNN